MIAIILFVLFMLSLAANFLLYLANPAPITHIMAYIFKDSIVINVLETGKISWKRATEEHDLGFLNLGDDRRMFMDSNSAYRSSGHNYYIGYSNLAAPFNVHSAAVAENMSHQMSKTGSALKKKLAEIDVPDVFMNGARAMKDKVEDVNQLSEKFEKANEDLKDAAEDINVELPTARTVNLAVASQAYPLKMTAQQLGDLVDHVRAEEATKGGLSTGTKMIIAVFSMVILTIMVYSVFLGGGGSGAVEGASSALGG